MKPIPKCTLSAKFFLVFGEGMSMGDADWQLAAASEADIAEWSHQGSLIWAGFEALMENVINGDGSMLDKYPTYRMSLWDKFKQLFSYRWWLEHVQ